MLLAIANDEGFENIFVSQLKFLGREGDIFMPITTSGSSQNLVAAARYAKSNGIYVVALTGGDGGEIKGHAGQTLICPKSDIREIQAGHRVALEKLVSMLKSE